MLYSIKNKDELEKLNELIFLENEVRELRLQDDLGWQNFHENMKKVLEPITDTFQNTSEGLTKTMMLTSKENNKALDILTNRVL